jgi:Putative Flp pilus-assembly TadE/G-like
VRRLGPSRNNERGAISVIVAILMVALLGFTAIAVDIGILYSERAQLQNGSDAAALFVAQKCATNLTDPGCSATSSLAGDVANKNALDGMSNIKSITLDTTNRIVSVAVGAKEAGSAPNKVSLFFARALGLTSAEVAATSRAQWGTPSKGTTILPLALAECKFNLDAAVGVGTEQVLELSVNGCGGIPGGFGWLKDTTDSKCGITVTAGPADNAGTWVYSDTGASMPTECTASDLSKMNNQTVLLPLYAVATGTGSGGAYYIKGFAAFHVTAYHFASASWQTSGGQICNKCIRGRFVEFVSLSQALELGGAPDYGTSVVRLTIGGS